MKPRVSIVVPIYNVDSYLGRCLDSLLRQTLADIEIVAVNDGSTDGCADILARYRAIDERIVVIDKPNGGVSSARNEGVRAARGDYIGFVDPDDWVDAGMYEAMYDSAISNNADIVMCTYTREFGTHAREKKFDLPERSIYRGEEVQACVLRRLIGPLEKEIGQPELLDAWGTVWSKLYRSELVQANGLSFVDLSEIGTNEDSLFNIHAFRHARSFVLLNKPYYHYWRANAASVTTGYKPDLQDKWFQLYRRIESFIQDNGLPPDYETALSNRICLSTLGLGLNAISTGNSASVAGKMRKLRGILGDSRIRGSFRQFETAYCPPVWKVFYWCAKYRFVAGYYALLLAIEWLRKTGQ